MNKPILVGITGGIGSGKSVVCKIFETLGASVYYADDRAKLLMEEDKQLINSIEQLFGEAAYENGKINRKHIAKQAFDNPELLTELNKLVHPAVGQDFTKWVKQNKSESILLKEAALLVETGSYKQLDKLIVVTAPERLRIERVLKRDGHRTEEDVKKIIAKQLSDQEKIQYADYTIDNSGNESVIAQTMRVRESILT